MRQTISSVAATLALTALVTSACNKKLRDYGEVGGDAGETGKSGGGQGGDSDLGQTQPLSVVEVSPTSGAVDVERDVPVVVTFSAAVDPESVTTSSFEVLGVDGPVAGTLTVEDEVVTFQPERRWHLYSEVTVEVSTALKGKRGERLAEGAESSFFVRDGEFGVPQLLAGESDLGAAHGANNDNGDALIAWLVPGGQAVKVIGFRSSEQSWSTETTFADLGEQASNVAVAINSEGNGLLAWGHGSEESRWVRFSQEDGWGTPAPALGRVQGQLALADGGRGARAWQVSVSGEWEARASILGDEWSDAEELGVGSGQVFGVGDDLYLALRTSGTEDYDIRVATSSGWSPFASVGPLTAFSPVTHGSRSLAAVSHEGGIGVIPFEGGSWGAPEWLGTGTLPRAAMRGPNALLVWSLAETLGVRARLRLDGTAWTPAVDLDSSGIYPGATGVIDSAGNATVFWAIDDVEGVRTAWCRYLARTGWSTVRHLPLFHELIRPWVDSEGNVTFVYVDVDGLWLARLQ